MEELETDDKLIENLKGKKNQPNNSRYLLIGICLIVALSSICILFKYISTPKTGVIDSSKKNLFYLFILL